MRCFVAVDVTGELKAEIIKLRDEMYQFVIGKVVEEENLHFTLKFLGEITEAQTDTVKIALENVAGDFRPFDVELAGTGAFPNKNYVKVLWVGAPKLFNLQEAVCAALPGVSQDHDIIPHLTLARVKNIQDKDKLAAFMKKYRNVVFGSMQVSNIKLKRSILKPTGPVYEDLAVFGLTA